MRSYIRLFKISDVKYIMPRFSYYVFEKNWVSEIFWDLVSSQWPLKRLSFPERNIRLIFLTKMTLSLPKFPAILVTVLIRVGFGMGSFRDLESQIPIPRIRNRDFLFLARSKNPENPEILRVGIGIWKSRLKYPENPEIPGIGIRIFKPRKNPENLEIQRIGIWISKSQKNLEKSRVESHLLF